VAFASTAWTASGSRGEGYRQHVKISEVIWPVTAHSFGTVTVAAYRAWGPARSRRSRCGDGDLQDKRASATTAAGVSH
jgi:hypothetical protein